MNAEKARGRARELVCNVLLSVTVFSPTLNRALLKVEIILNLIYDP